MLKLYYFIEIYSFSLNSLILIIDERGFMR